MSVMILGIFLRSFTIHNEGTELSFEKLLVLRAQAGVEFVMVGGIRSPWRRRVS